MANDDMERYRRAMRQLESSGNYSAKGPVVKKGRYRGDRAYGAYQVMGLNIPSWTQQALGRSMTPDQFLADRGAQDAVFNHFFGASLRKYGNPADAASVWHSGRPLARARAAGANDGYMATSAYVNKFLGFAGGKGLTEGAINGYSRPSRSGGSPAGDGGLPSASALQTARFIEGLAARDNGVIVPRVGTGNGSLEPPVAPRVSQMQSPQSSLNQQQPGQPLELAPLITPTYRQF